MSESKEKLKSLPPIRNHADLDALSESISLALEDMRAVLGVEFIVLLSHPALDSGSVASSYADLASAHRHLSSALCCLEQTMTSPTGSQPPAES